MLGMRYDPVYTEFRGEGTAMSPEVRPGRAFKDPSYGIASWNTISPNREFWISFAPVVVIFVRWMSSRSSFGRDCRNGTDASVISVSLRSSPVQRSSAHSEGSRSSVMEPSVINFTLRNRLATLFGPPHAASISSQIHRNLARSIWSFFLSSSC